MSLITFTALQDGVTGVNAAATNNPLNTIYDDYNGNITDANISASAAIAFSKIAGGSSTALGAWQSWTPTWANLTIGNAVVNAKYSLIGKTVNFTIDVTFGSGSSMSTGPTFTLPVTAVSYVSANNHPFGTTLMTLSSAGTVFVGVTAYSSTTIGSLFEATSSPLTLSNITSTAPFSWTAGSILSIIGSYQSA